MFAINQTVMEWVMSIFRRVLKAWRFLVVGFVMVVAIALLERLSVRTNRLFGDRKLLLLCHSD
jgi:hypothetical protein